MKKGKGMKMIVSKEHTARFCRECNQRMGEDHTLTCGLMNKILEESLQATVNRAECGNMYPCGHAKDYFGNVSFEEHLRINHPNENPAPAKESYTEECRKSYGEKRG